MPKKDSYKLQTATWIANGKKPRGFSSLSPERRKEISSKAAKARWDKRKETND